MLIFRFGSQTLQTERASRVTAEGMSSSGRSRGRKRKNPAANDATIRVALSAPRITASICSRIARDLVKFILYMRQQIPCPYDELKAEMEEKHQSSTDPSDSSNRRKKKILSSKARRMKSLIEETDSLLESLDVSLFQNFRISEVLFLLGPSIYSPKEVYSLVFSNRDSQSSDEEFSPSDASKKFVRAMITSNSPTFDREMKSTKLFTLVKSSGLPSDSAVLEIPQFKLKLNFKLKMKKAALVNVYMDNSKFVGKSEFCIRNRLLDSKSQNPVGGNSDINAPINENVDKELWSICKAIPKGLKSVL